jgi:hypothetical protein
MPPVFHQSGLHHLLHPINQAVPHDVGGHIHLRLRHRALAYQRNQRAKGQRVQQHADGPRCFLKLFLNSRHHVFALLRIGRVDV